RKAVWTGPVPRRYPVWELSGRSVVLGERSDGIFRRSPEESKSAEERVESALDSCRLGHLGSHVVRLGSGRRSTITVHTPWPPLRPTSGFRRRDAHRLGPALRVASVGDGRQ